MNKDEPKIYDLTCHRCAKLEKVIKKLKAENNKYKIVFDKLF